MTFDDWWGAYPTQEDYEANCRDAWEASAASRDSEISELRQQLADAHSHPTMEACRQMIEAQAVKENEELHQQLAELLDWQQKAFAAHPNIDIDIDRMN